MKLTLTVPASAEPLTRDEVAIHLRVGANETFAESAYLDALIVAARTQAEQFTGRALITQTWQLKLDDWQLSKIILPRLDVQSITQVQYIDVNGATQTLASNQYALTGDGNRLLVPAYGVTWPSLRQFSDVVTVTFVAGFGAAASVPQPIKNWLLLKIAALYENREGMLVGQTVAKHIYADALLDPYRVFFA